MKILKRIFGGIVICAVLLSLVTAVEYETVTVAVEIGPGPLIIKDEALFATGVTIAVEVGPGPMVVKA